MAKLGELSHQKIEVDMANAPEQFGDWAPPPQPGRNYGFMLPRFSEDYDWEEYDADEHRRRLVVNFSKGKELIVVDSPTGKSIGDPVRFRISNEERKFGDDQDKSAVSPMHYLFKESFGIDMSGKTNADFARGFLALGGKKFRARVLYTGYCNPEKDRYIFAADGSSVPDKGTMGCGQRWALQARTNKKTGEQTLAIPRNTTPDAVGSVEPGEYFPRFVCQCGASIGVFVELRNFAPFEKQEEGATTTTGGNGQEKEKLQQVTTPPAAISGVRASPTPTSAPAAPKATGKAPGVTTTKS